MSLDATDLWQPVDAGYGRLLKQKVREVTDEWLEEGDNLDIWMGNSEDPEKKFIASRRRILITRWVAIGMPIS